MRAGHAMAIAFMLFLIMVPLTACTPSVQRFGGAMAPTTRVDGVSRPSFVIEQGDDAGEAVRAALVEAGYEAREESLLRIDVGFAVRPRRTAVVVPDAAGHFELVSPPGKPALTFCKQQNYVLTLALVERSSGRIRARGGATMSRCNGASSAVLPILARAAVAQIS